MMAAVQVCGTLCTCAMHVLYGHRLTCADIAPALGIGIMAKLATLISLHQLLGFILALGYRNLLHKARWEVASCVLDSPCPPAIWTLLNYLLKR